MWEQHVNRESEKYNTGLRHLQVQGGGWLWEGMCAPAGPAHLLSACSPGSHKDATGLCLLAVAVATLDHAFLNSARTEPSSFLPKL